MVPKCITKGLLLRNEMHHSSFLNFLREWSGGAMVLGKLPVPGRPTILDYSRTRAYCAYSRCGWGCLDIFTHIYPFSPLSPSLWETAIAPTVGAVGGCWTFLLSSIPSLSPSLWETARYRLKYCLQGPLNPKQATTKSIFYYHQYVN